MKIKVGFKDIDWLLFLFLIAFDAINVTDLYLSDKVLFKENFLGTVFATIFIFLIDLTISYKRHNKWVYIILMALVGLDFIISLLGVVAFSPLHWIRYIIDIAVLLRLYNNFKLTNKKKLFR